MQWSKGRRKPNYFQHMGMCHFAVFVLYCMIKKRFQIVVPIYVLYSVMVAVGVMRCWNTAFDSMGGYLILLVATGLACKANKVGTSGMAGDHLRRHVSN